jgi:hypothetical protein
LNNIARLVSYKYNEGLIFGGGGDDVTNLSYFRFIFMSRFMFIFVKEHSNTIRFPSMFPCVPSIVCLVYQLIFCMGYFGLYFPELITPYILEAFLASSANTLTSPSLETCKQTNIKICTYNFYPCTKILRTQKFAKQALIFTTVK